MKTMGIIRLGIQVPSFSFGAGRSGANASGKALSADAGIFENLVDVATVAEAAGFDSFFLMDHYRQIPMVGAPVDPMPEAYTVLGGIAGRTSTIMLGTLVSGVTYRNPAVLAKMVTTLDVVSSGRAILGIGAAWLDTEHDSYGIEFPPVSERMDRLEEAVQICRMMFDEEAPSFQGRYYTIKDAFNFPRPLQAGGPPILVGGGGERRTLQIVAMHADACNVFGDVSTIQHKMDVLARHCESCGRDPGTITRTRLGTLVIGETTAEAAGKLSKLAEARGYSEAQSSTVIWGDPDTVAETARSYLDAGLDGLIFNFPDPLDTADVALAGEALTSI
ncbi:MAG: LLM class F420-dependent oxidoreductase [Actinobacteria bacterium]|jgi:F420-dependent oxidoreductase-like protein|nr:LLM class F420-dependent oxidoreductase [Actinomycetota bacterium]